MEDYNKVLLLIQEIDQENNFTLLNDDIYVYSLKLYKKELFQNITVSSSIICLKEPRSIFETLINITLLSLNYMHNRNKTTCKKDIIQTNQLLFQKKNEDYGNSFVDFGLIGIIVRLNDKINRLLTLLSKTSPKTPQVSDERIEDTINDLYNYGIIALMYKFS